MVQATKVEIHEFGDATPQVGSTEIPPNVVHVWKRSLHSAQAVVDACYELLSPEERERAARYRVERARCDYILTRSALRSLAAGYLRKTPQDLSFRYSEFGKPSLDGRSDLRFNVSHTEGQALLAFAREREIGVDVEQIRPALDARQLAERFFSVHERRSLESLSGDALYAAFFRCWTRKEAYVKARGSGLSLPLHQFDVSIAAADPQALLATRPDASEASRWILRDLPVSPGYAAALAAEVAVDC